MAIKYASLVLDLESNKPFDLVDVSAQRDAGTT
jgi:hypothetical protein